MPSILWARNSTPDPSLDTLKDGRLGAYEIHWKFINLHLWRAVQLETTLYR
jgi:hypothetical protein